MKIYQGDQYAIPIKVKRNSVVQTPTEIQKLEVVLAGMRKEYPGEIEWHAGSSQFLYPLNQDESFALEADTYDVLGRPLYSDGTITGWQSMGSITVFEMEGAQEL